MERIRRMMAGLLGVMRTLGINEGGRPGAEFVPFPCGRQMLLPGIIEPYRLEALRDESREPSDAGQGNLPGPGTGGQ